MKKMWIAILMVSISFLACEDSVSESNFSENQSSNELFVESSGGASSFGEISSNSSDFLGTVIDSRDSKVYKTVIIGTQTWFAENLNYGSHIFVADSIKVIQEGTQKFCYDNDNLNCETEGGLYQWHTAMGLTSECISLKACSRQISEVNHQGICPLGWHIPNSFDWNLLSSELGGRDLAGEKLKNVSFGGSNSSGFSALGAGYYQPYFENDFNIPVGFIEQNRQSFYWVAEESDMTSGNHFYLNNHVDYFEGSNDYKDLGFSVRCLKD